jgi:hypothetical protein
MTRFVASLVTVAVVSMAQVADAQILRSATLPNGGQVVAGAQLNRNGLTLGQGFSGPNVQVFDSTNFSRQGQTDFTTVSAFGRSVSQVSVDGRFQDSTTKTINTPNGSFQTSSTTKPLSTTNATTLTGANGGSISKTVTDKKFGSDQTTTTLTNANGRGISVVERTNRQGETKTRLVPVR